MHLVVKFWEPRNGQLEHCFANARALSFLNETITIICVNGLRHCYPVCALVQIEGDNDGDGKLASPTD